MELRKGGSKKEPERGAKDSQRRFQIVKLEERIAPRVGPCRGGCGHYAPGRNK